MLIYFHRPTSVVEVRDHEALRDMWSDFDHFARSLVGRIIVRKPLTPSQFNRLSKQLQRLIEQPTAS